MRLACVVIALVVTGATARADERLTKQEILAAADAAIAALPKVDSAKAAHCKGLPITTSKEIAAAATCFRQAGSLAIAIAFWRRASQDQQDDPTAMAAALQVGPAEEAAGAFAPAAMAYEHVVGTWPATKLVVHVDVKVSRDLLTRAMCIYRQLGQDRDALRDQATLEGYGRRKPIDAAAICTALRPIRVPGT